MAKTIIIVEDNNDKYTFEAIIRHIHLSDNLLVQDTPDIDWEFVSAEKNAEEPTALIAALRGLQNDIFKEKYDKIAIVQDIDFNSKENRLLLVNTAFQTAYPVEYQEITDTNTLVPFSFIQDDAGMEEPLTVLVACHFVGLTKNGIKQGEIEDILKAVKAQPSPLADCIDEHLPECMKVSEEKLRDKDLVKQWINNYQRYDTLQKKKRNYKATQWENVMAKRADIFDFNRDEVTDLKELKDFLLMMI